VSKKRDALPPATDTPQAVRACVSTPKGGYWSR
jgi:hypothetical protein